MTAPSSSASTKENKILNGEVKTDEGTSANLGAKEATKEEESLKTPDETSDDEDKGEAPVSSWLWTLLTIITIIPIVNIIVVVFMIFAAKKQTLRNWAASRLHLCIIAIALVAVLFLTGIIPQNVVSVLKEEGSKLQELIDYRTKGILKKGYSTAHLPTYKTSNGDIKISIIFSEAMKEITEANKMHSTFLTLDGKAASIRVEESENTTSEAELSSESTRVVMPYTGQGLSGFVYGGNNGTTQMILRNEELKLNIVVASEVDIESIYVEKDEAVFSS